MIGWEDVYKVVVAMVPLYVALLLGYVSVKWWRMFTPDHCDAINRLSCYFIIPFFTFQFMSAVNPYAMNYHFMAGDMIAKALIGVTLALWANFGRYGSFSWAITSFALSSLNNSLLVGVPLLEAMYGAVGKDLVVQSSVMQSLMWSPLLLFLHEYRDNIKTYSNINVGHDNIINSSNHDPSAGQSQELDQEDQNSNTPNVDDNIINDNGDVAEARRISSSFSFRTTMRRLWVKLFKNPNFYACIVGLIWALIARRCDLEMPSIVGGSIQIFAKAGTGVAMFNMGLFMALQEKVIAGGVRLMIYSMVIRFVGGPLTTAVGSLTLGLRGDILRVAILQAALPQSVVTFMFAQQYGLHSDVLSTAVSFGTIISLPLLIAYYFVFEVVH